MSDLYWCEYNAGTAANAECRFLKRPHDRLEPSRDAEGRLLALLVVDDDGEPRARFLSKVEQGVTFVDHDRVVVPLPEGER